MLSMPRGVDPLYVMKAAREFADTELADHKYVMVLHDHQANPHVHLSVRAESRHGKRLNPRKADLSRWRQTFAEKLRGWGVEAETSSRGVRGQGHVSEPLWRIKAREDQRLISARRGRPSSRKASSDGWVREAWVSMSTALAASPLPSDHKLGTAIERHTSISKDMTPLPSHVSNSRGLER